MCYRVPNAESVKQQIRLFVSSRCGRKEAYFLVADIKKYTLENYDEHYNKLYRYRELL